MIDVSGRLDKVRYSGYSGAMMLCDVLRELNSRLGDDDIAFVPEFRVSGKYAHLEINSYRLSTGEVFDFKNKYSRDSRYIRFMYSNVCKVYDDVSISNVCINLMYSESVIAISVVIGEILDIKLK